MKNETEEQHNAVKHTQTDNYKKEKGENEALVQISYYYWDVEVVCITWSYM